MGKKKGARSSNADADAADAPKAFVLRVPTHCRCDGCGDKVRAAVKDLTLRCEGIVSLDQSALATRGELAVVATADPERLRRRLRKATGKSVDLVFPKPPAKAAAVPAAPADAAATVQELLARLQLQQQQQQPVMHGRPVPVAAGAWNALQLGAYGQPAYPWVAPPEPYLAAYPAAASWGACPHDGYGGGWIGY